MTTFCELLNSGPQLGLGNFQLQFIHDRNGREVDFIVTKDKQPWFLMEAKLSDETFSPHLRYFSERLKIPGIQLVLKSGVYRKEGNLCCISADRWLGCLV